MIKIVTDTDVAARISSLGINFCWDDFFEFWLVSVQESLAPRGTGFVEWPWFERSPQSDFPGSFLKSLSSHWLVVRFASQNNRHKKRFFFFREIHWSATWGSCIRIVEISFSVGSIYVWLQWLLSSQNLVLSESAHFRLQFLYFGKGLKKTTWQSLAPDFGSYGAWQNVKGLSQNYTKRMRDRVKLSNLTARLSKLTESEARGVL